MSNHPSRHGTGTSDRPAAGCVLHKKKGTSEEAGRENISTTSGRNLFAKENDLSVQPQLSWNGKRISLVSHCHKMVFLK